MSSQITNALPVTSLIATTAQPIMSAVHATQDSSSQVEFAPSAAASIFVKDAVNPMFVQSATPLLQMPTHLFQLLSSVGNVSSALIQTVRSVQLTMFVHNVLTPLIAPVLLQAYALFVKISTAKPAAMIVLHVSPASTPSTQSITSLDNV